MMMMYSILYLGPKGLKETPPSTNGMNRKTIEDNTDILHDDCFNNHARCLI